MAESTRRETEVKQTENTNTVNGHFERRPIKDALYNNFWQGQKTQSEHATHNAICAAYKHRKVILSARSKKSA